MPDDPRPQAYQTLAQQLASQNALNRSSAHKVLSILFEYVRPQSLLDVGCGTGAWLAVARELGIGDVRGVEGQWLDASRLEVEAELVTMMDLERPFDLGRSFEVLVCLEVAEHLSASAAPGFIESLTGHAKQVVFSAAVPFQGGQHHVNERFLDYWIELFSHHGFRPLDIFRGRIWNAPDVLWWLWQNVILFAHDDVIAANERLRREREVLRPLSIIHPAVYADRVQQNVNVVAYANSIIQIIASGGFFSVTKLADGKLLIKPVEGPGDRM